MPAAEMPHKPAINVVFLTDQKYANLTAVAIRSLVFEFEKSASCREYALAIFVVCVEVQQGGRDDLARTAKPDHDDSDISLTLVDHVLEGNPQGKQRWKQLVSVKLHLPNILAGIDRGIFLDSDIVVVDDIAKLWQIDLEGHWLGVAPCIFNNPVSLRNYNLFKIRFKHAGEPINAGVLLFDLALMRKLDVTGKLVAWQRDNARKLQLPEQEAISANYPQQWKVLPHAWNFRPYGETYWAASSWDEYRNYLDIRPSIVHFQANVRPFDMCINLPFYERWKYHYLHVNPGRVLNRKKLGYFQFIFFDCPEILCRVSNYLPGGLTRLVLMGTLVGLAAFPSAIGRYLRYLKNPDAYEPEITRLFSHLSKLSQQDVSQVAR